MKRLSDSSTNRIIAYSAIIISAASFYVTVQQTRATQQQVKAETWPYLQIDTGNFDLQRDDYVINYSMVNVGVGPARVASMNLSYEGNTVRNVGELIDACCKEAVDIEEGSTLTRKDRIGSLYTANPAPLILSSESRVDLFLLAKTEHNLTLWDRMNRARNRIKAEACFCSVLNDCWETDFVSEPRPVERCSSDLNNTFRG